MGQVHSVPLIIYNTVFHRHPIMRTMPLMAILHGSSPSDHKPVQEQPRGLQHEQRVDPCDHIVGHD